MNRSNTTKGIRLTALILAIMMLLIMLFSSWFIAVHVDHDCTGEDCPICAIIWQCENTIRTIGSGVVIVAYVMLPLSIVLFFISTRVPSFLPDTPVSIKVRLNN